MTAGNDVSLDVHTHGDRPGAVPALVGLGSPPTLLSATFPPTATALRNISRQSFVAFITRTLSSNSGFLKEGLKWVAVLGMAEGLNKAGEYLLWKLKEIFIVEATVHDGDHAYQWILEWISGSDHQSTAKTFDVFSRERLDLEGGGGRPGAQVVFHDGGHSIMRRGGGGKRTWTWAALPKAGKVNFLRSDGRWLAVVRTQAAPGLVDVVQRPGASKDSITIYTFGFTQGPLDKLIDQARERFEKKDAGRLTVFTCSQNGNQWSQVVSKIPRKMSSVVLPKEIKDSLKKDVEGFYEDKQWYSDRGIPHRRGYLLYGVPGSGKTSLCTALAGELGLKIYVINLAQKGMDDSKLNELINQTSSRSMVLIEDIDCAFPKRESDKTESQEHNQSQHPIPIGPPSGFAVASVSSMRRPGPPGPGVADESRSFTVTFSGLLNAIDGVAAQEGNVVFATTNFKENLDPALSRPGRLDVWVEFKNASQQQALDLFRNFFPTTSETSSQEKETNLPGAFASHIPDDMFSMAQLQGFLILHKKDPERAVEKVAGWVKEQRESRGE